MPVTVKDIYDRTKELSDEEKVELVSLLLEDVAPEPPSTVHTRAEFDEAVFDGLNSGSTIEVGPDYWESLEARIQARDSKR